MPRRLLALLVVPLLAGCGISDDADRAGVSRAPIIGGHEDHFRSYVVGVGTPYDAAGGGGPFCSGTLVSRRTVVTAGHCVTPEAGAKGGVTAIFFGADLTPPLARGATMVGTVRAVRHPQFDPLTLTHDLAVVELAEDAPSQAVPLLRETMTNTTDFVGPPLTFVGYGNDGHGHYGVRRAAVFAIDAVGPSCAGHDTGSGPIDATQIYYRVPDENTCDGDSGGPAFFRRGGVERLAGATSAGDPSCVVDGTDARTDAPAIDAFLQPMIDRFEGADPCRADGVCNESCNTGPELVDPDCAPQHCGADGICVLSCTDPPDPDCGAIDHRGRDGVCDPAASPEDPDCAPYDPSSVSLDDDESCRDAGSALSAPAPSASSSAAGGGPSTTNADVPSQDLAGSEAGCAAGGRGGGAWGGVAISLALALSRRRRPLRRTTSR